MHRVYASQPLINVAFTFFNAREAGLLKKRIFYLSALLIAAFTAVMTIIYYLIPQFLIVHVGTQEYLDLAPQLWLAAVFGGLYCEVMLVIQNFLARGRVHLSWSLLGLVLQTLGIILFHQSSLTVMSVNILVSIFLLAFLLLLDCTKGHRVA